MIDFKNISQAELRQLCEKEYYSKSQQRMHYLMLYATRPLLKTNITPNQISTFWVILQLVASTFMVVGSYWGNIIGILLYTLAMLLDYVDGQIARIKKISTYKGIFLEELGLYFGNPIFFLCLGIGTARAFGNYWYFILGVISCIAQLYSKLAVVNPDSYKKTEFREKILEIKSTLTMRSTKRKRLDWVFFLFRRSQPLNFLFVGLLFNIPQVVLIVYTLLFILDLTRKLYEQLRMLYKLDKELLLQK